MIVVKKDGRTIRTGAHYTAFRKELFADQARRCIRCNRVCSLDVPLEFDNAFHISHRGSRGMGMAIRDDVVGTKRGQVEGGICGCEHRQDHGQQALAQTHPQWGVSRRA